MRALLAALLATCALAVVACGGGGGTATPGSKARSTALSTPAEHSTATPTGEALPNATAAARRTGIPEVDAIINAVESGDIDALVALMRFTDSPCSRALPGHTLACPTSAPDGTMVEAFLRPSCEGVFLVTVSEAEHVVRTKVAEARPSVFAVYRTTSESAFGMQYYPHVDYAVMLTYDIEQRPAGLALLVGGGALVGLDDDCGFPPAEMADLQHFGEVVLPPP